MSGATIKPAFAFWLGLLAFFVGLMWLFQSIMLPFVLGVVIAYLLNPAVQAFERAAWPRWAAVLFLLCVFLGVVALGFVLLVPVLFNEVSQIATRAPVWFTVAQEFLRNLAARFGVVVPADAQALLIQFQDQIQSQAGQIFNVGRNVLSGLLAGGAAIASFAAFAALMPIVAFYTMADWPKITRTLNDLLPRQHAAVIVDLLAQIDRSIAGFIRGQLMVCLFLGLFYGIGLSAIGLDYGFVIGMSAGILAIMPYVGSGFGLVASTSVAWFTTGDPVMVGLALAIFVIGQLIEGNFLTPKLVGENVGLHPLWIIFALMAGGSLMGFTGLLIAVPVAAVLGVMVRFSISEYKKSAYYGG